MASLRVKYSVALYALLLSVLIFVPAASGGASAPTRILVGPDVLVSAGEEYPHMEMMIASDPRDPKRVFGASITFSRPDDSPACRTYASTDGGYTWSSDTLAEMVTYGGADPQVAYSVRGTALFAGLINRTDAKGQPHADLLVYRSKDGGTTWQQPVDLGHSYDHEQIAVDRSGGPHNGRIYIGALYSAPGWKPEMAPKLPAYIVGLFHSDDDGRTFTGPIEATRGHDDIGVNVADVLVGPDGSVYAPFMSFPVQQAQMEKTSVQPLWMVKSSDGGMHYSKPKLVATMYVGLYRDWMKSERMMRFDRPAFPQFAIDDSHGPYRGAIYGVWSDMKSGQPRILLTRSLDGGNTWSSPHAVIEPRPSWSSQFQATIAVNAQGVLGLTWFDTRDSPAQDSYREYFAASMDGGRTFLPPALVSSAASYPRGPGDVRFTPWQVDTSEPVLGMRFGSAFQRWPNGGDYMGLTSDATGTFRALWADARTGMFQIWTAPLRVGLPDPPVNAAAAVVTKKVTILFGKSTYDPDSRVFSFPIRLKNVSNQTIFGPLSVKVTSIVDPWDIRFKRVDSINTPTIVNAANGKQGVGAVFDYSRALGDFTSLPPGAATGAVVWKLKLASAARPYIGVDVTGFLSSGS